MLPDISNGGLLRADHGYWGAQLVAPYVSEEVAWAIRYHQALRYFADESVGFKYPDAYDRFFGPDYEPPEYIRRAHQEARAHKWYMTSRLMRALIGERRRMTRVRSTHVRGAALLASLQRLIHFKITGYGTAATYATMLPRPDDVQLLHRAGEGDGEPRGPRAGAAASVRALYGGYPALGHPLSGVTGASPGSAGRHGASTGPPANKSSI